jgi:hypothetical protein
MHKEYEIKPKTSRAITIKPTADNITGGPVKSYNINLLKTITTDIEKIQILRNEVKRVENGGQEISGILKNISNFKTDAVLIATFRDFKEETVGIKILKVNDMGPNSLRKFSLLFTPSEVDIIKSHTLDIGEMIEGIIEPN